MAHYKLGVMNGDGIGPEIVASSVEVLRAAAKSNELSIELVPLAMGWEAIRAGRPALPPETIAELEGVDGWIMGPHDSASYPEAERTRLNPSGDLRIRFELYANIRPARALKGIPALSPNMDLVIARENTEGFYSDRNMAQGSGELVPSRDMVLTVGKFTRHAAERIARVGFALALQRRKRVAIVHKMNVLRNAYGLFVETCRAVGRDFPGVAVESVHIDAMAALLVRRGTDYDVIITTNMFGDILSDLAAELSGSLGLAPSINAGDRHVMAQAAHGSAPDIAGQSVANPLGMILSTAMLLNHLGQQRHDASARAVAASIDKAVAAAVASGTRTRDLGGTASTKDMTAAIIRVLR
ncbi:MAG: isocitrate/isopropylmalate dehydrogenase family protein [Alphaproteobacteria bacterium]|nr:isocitrate/isopropylmalate dehydrogenase family protein [Alphaproteobacteria bacterium]